jgi:hypothetical protein
MSQEPPQSPVGKSGFAIFGFIAMSLLTYPLYLRGYVSKGWGTFIDFLIGFVPLYAYLKHREDKRSKNSDDEAAN